MKPSVNVQIRPTRPRETFSCSLTERSGVSSSALFIFCRSKENRLLSRCNTKPHGILCCSVSKRIFFDSEKHTRTRRTSRCSCVDTVREFGCCENIREATGRFRAGRKRGYLLSWFLTSMNSLGGSEALVILTELRAGRIICVRFRNERRVFEDLPWKRWLVGLLYSICLYKLVIQGPPKYLVTDVEFWNVPLYVTKMN